MRKPFDLEKAKAGAPVLDGDLPVHFIGESKIHKGCVVLEYTTGDVSVQYMRELSMAPVKVTRYINLYPDATRDVVYGGGEYTSYPTKEEAEDSANYESALAVAVPIEVEE